MAVILSPFKAKDELAPMLVPSMDRAASALPAAPCSTARPLTHPEVRFLYAVIEVTRLPAAFLEKPAKLHAPTTPAAGFEPNQGEVLPKVARCALEQASVPAPQCRQAWSMASMSGQPHDTKTDPQPRIVPPPVPHFVHHERLLERGQVANSSVDSCCDTPRPNQGLHPGVVVVLSREHSQIDVTLVGAIVTGR
jgi:hypothetical protein